MASPSQKHQFQDINVILSSIVEHFSPAASPSGRSPLHLALLAIIGGASLLLHGLTLCFAHVSAASFHAIALSSNVETESSDSGPIQPSPIINPSYDDVSEVSLTTAMEQNVSLIPDQLDFSYDRSATTTSRDLASQQKKFSRDDIVLFRIAKLVKGRQDQEIFFQVVTSQDVTTLAALLSAGVSPNFLGQNGRAPVHEAAIRDHKGILSQLKTGGADIWLRCKNGRTALEYAVVEGKKTVVEYLLCFISDKMYETGENYPGFPRLIELAISHGHETIAAMLDDKCEHKETQRRSMEKEAKKREFVSAVADGDIRAVRKLLNEGISDWRALAKAIELNLVTMTAMLLSSMEAGHDYDLDTAIDVACTVTDRHILQTLISKHTCPQRAARQAIIKKIEIQEDYFCLAWTMTYEVDREILLERAAWYKNLSVVHGLMKDPKEGTFSKESINIALNSACTPELEDLSEDRCVSVAEYLLVRGANPNTPVSVWGNNLQRAAANGHHKLLDLLILYGGNVNAIGAFGGRTPLMAAVCTRRWNTVSFLLERGARITGEERGLVGNILQTACYFGPVEIVEVLLDRGVNINERVNPYGSPLLLALQGGHQDIAELLISKGVDLSASCPINGTVLHYAAMLGMEKMVKLLVEAGVDVNAEGGKYGSALQTAVAKGHSMIALYLLDNGANVNHKGGYYGSALNAAEDENHHILKKLLLFNGARVVERPQKIAEQDVNGAFSLFSGAKFAERSKKNAGEDEKAVFSLFGAHVS